jgi:hypothetical protein
MRQGNGSDLLGGNDPRSATIGVIYVAPTDDRESVLAAILTQEKLGREQIAIVLPNLNKAFHLPVDFDGLKNLRNKLQAKLVIVAPYGSGPAEFARQRRFTCFTSLENYSKSLRDEKEASRLGRSGRRLFGRRQPKLQVMDSGVTNAGDELEPTGFNAEIPPAAEDKGASSEDATDNQQLHPNADAAAMSMGSLGQSSGNVSTHTPDDDTALPPFSQHNAMDDDVSFASTAVPLIVDSSSANSGPAQDTMSPPLQKPDDAEPSPGGDIITFPTRKRNTVKLIALPPSDDSETDGDYSAAAAPPVAASRRNSGKTPVVVPPTTGITPVSTGRKVNTGNLAAFGGNPPGGGNTVGGGRRRRRGWGILIALLLLLLASLFLCVTLAFAAPGYLPTPVRNFVTGIVGGGTPSATVTITPKSADELNTYVLTGVTSGTPDTAKRQVQARQLTYTTPPQSKTVSATGTVDTQPVQATGTLTFFNGNGSAYTVAARTVFTDANGVQVANNSLVVIPAGSPATGYGQITVPATAITGGSMGNIRYHDFSLMQCCGSGSVFVTSSAFSGGQDPQHYTAVQQSDIDGASTPLKQPLTQSAQSTLNGMKHANEQFVAKPTCTTKVVTDHNVGDRASSVTVTVSSTCAGEVYDQVGAQTIAANLLKNKALQDLSSSYSLVGNIVTSITQTTTDRQGNLSLFVKAEGIWVYQFSDAQKTQLAKDIKGLKKKDAITLLEKQPGVGQVGKIDITGNNGTTLPTDYTQITIVVQNVPGVQGTGTPTSNPGGSVTPTTPSVTPPLTSPTPVPTPSVGGS